MSEINAHSYNLMYQEAILSILWLKTGIRDLPLYLLAERRTAAQQQMATAFVRPQPTTSMQLQINIPQQKPGPYSQQAPSQPPYSDQFSHQQQQQHAPMQQMQPPSSSQRPHAPGPVIPRVAQANRMMRPPVSAGPRMAPPPSQMMPPPPLVVVVCNPSKFEYDLCLLAVSSQVAG